MKLEPKNFFEFFLMIFFTVVIAAALEYNAKARLIPLLVAIPCLAMALYRFAVSLAGKEKEGLSGEDELLKDILSRVDVAVDAVDHKSRKAKLTAEEKQKRFLNIVLWILGFACLIFLFGFMVAIPVFTFVYMFSKRESWIVSLSCAVGLGVSIYLAFVVVAKSSLYEGLVFRFLSP